MDVFFTGLTWQVVAVLLAPTLAIVVNGVIANRNARKAANEVKQATATIAASSINTNNKLEEIHGLVDGRLTEALKKIEGLEKRLFDQDGTLPSGGPTTPQG